MHQLESDDNVAKQGGYKLKGHARLL